MHDRCFESIEACNDAVRTLLLNELTRAHEVPTAVALSGGSTPLPVYQQIAQSHCIASENTYILFADDRLVPATSSDSNYGNLLPMLNALKIPEERVIHIHPELPLDQAAEKYNQDLDAFLKIGKIALALLGLGTDGHTCSLFSLEAAQPKHRWTIPVSQQAGFERISVTSDFLEEVKTIIFHVTGNKKESIINQLLKAPETLPAGLATQNNASKEIWHT